MGGRWGLQVRVFAQGFELFTGLDDERGAGTQERAAFSQTKAHGGQSRTAQDFADEWTMEEVRFHG